ATFQELIDSRYASLAMPAAGQRRHTFDEVNLALGQVSQRLAELTYDSRIISVKPKSSARDIRRALLAFAACAREDSPSDVHVHATIGLADCFTFLCEKYSLERGFAAGQMEPAFFEWLSEAAGAPVDTTRFIARCGESALHYAFKAV